MHEQDRKPAPAECSTKLNQQRSGLGQELKKTSEPSRGTRRRKERAKEMDHCETTSVSTVGPRATASRISESRKTNAMSASSMEEVTGPTAPSTSPKFELLPWRKLRHTQLPPSLKTPLPPFEEWTLNRCKPTSGIEQISQRSREKAKPSEYSGCSLGNRLFHSKLILSSCTTNRYDFIPTR